MGDVVKTAETESETKIVDLDAGGNWGAREIPLAHPFRFRGVEYRSVTLRTPNGDDVRAFYAPTKPSLVEFAIRLASFGPDAFGAMHASDVVTVLKAAGPFLD